MGLSNMLNGLMGKKVIPGTHDKDNLYELTNLGRREVENLEPEDYGFPVMAALQRRAMCLSDINRETGLGVNKTWEMVKKLMRQNLIKKVNAGEV